MFGEDVDKLVLGVYVSQLNVSLLIVVSQKVTISHLYVWFWSVELGYWLSLCHLCCHIKVAHF